MKLIKSTLILIPISLVLCLGIIFWTEYFLGNEALDEGGSMHLVMTAMGLFFTAANLTGMIAQISWLRKNHPASKSSTQILQMLAVLLYSPIALYFIYFLAIKKYEKAGKAP